MGESILGFFLTALFSSYGSEDITKLLRQAVKNDEYSSESIRQLADNFEQDSDMVKKVVETIRKNYKNLKYNEITI